jgi:hypothetical protein
MNQINVSAATTAELLAFFNAHSGTAAVKRFADRKTAERRVAALLAAMPAPAPAAEKRAAPTKKVAADKSAADRAASIALSWKDAAVAAARATRHGVRVTAKHGGSGNYRSVREAFLNLGLPLGRHIKFRGQLKAAGSAEFEGYTFKLLAV